MVSTETLAICARCGFIKSRALVACPKCRWQPKSIEDRTFAYALSDACIEPLEFHEAAEAIRGQRKPALSSSGLMKAAQIVRGELDNSNAPPTRAAAAGPVGGVPKVSIREDAPTRTPLENNPFAVLGATLRDNRKRLIELAEEQALHGDEAECMTARAAVSNPRTRLAAEVTWLPGASPSRIQSLLVGLRKNPGMIRAAQGLPTLTVANLTAAAFELIDPNVPAEAWAGWVVAMAEAEEAIDAEDVLRDINEERAVAGFPKIRDVADVEAALAEQRRYYKEAVTAALGRLPSLVLMQAITKAVSDCTAGGDEPAPVLIEEVGDAYGLRATPALEKGAEELRSCISDARKAAPRGATALKPYLDQIDNRVRRWDAVAQPVQLLMKTRGLDHEPSQALAYAIRSLAIDLVNEHGLIEEGSRLTQLLTNVFAELPEVVDRLQADSETLDSLMEQRQESEEDRREWERAITYSAEIGVLFKDTLSISPTGVSWKSHRFALEDVTRVRWGAVRNSVNGIPTGTNYTVGFGTAYDMALCETRQETVWSEFVDRLLKAVGFRITLGMLKDLGQGQNLRIGDAVIDDQGAYLPKHAFFGGSGPVYCRWHETHIWVADGSFYIGSRSDKKVYAQMAYLTTDNVHLLELAIRKFFKTSKARLSHAFDD